MIQILMIFLFLNQIYQEIYDDVKVIKEKEKEVQKEADDLRKERDEATAQEDSIFNAYRTCSKKFQELVSLESFKHFFSLLE